VAESGNIPELDKLIEMSATERAKGGGVLPINAAATRKINATQNQARGGQRQPAARLRLIIRRLPPGLAENEFWNALGEEWHLGKGKIDWAVYKDGKISKEYVLYTSGKENR
jgi:Smg-4/UPF3 family